MTATGSELDAGWIFGVGSLVAVLAGGAFRFSQASERLKALTEELESDYASRVEQNLEPAIEALVSKVISARRPAQSSPEGDVLAEPVGDALARAATHHDFSQLVQAADASARPWELSRAWVRWQHMLASIFVVDAVLLTVSSWSVMTGFHVSDRLQTIFLTLLAVGAIATTIAAVSTARAHNRLVRSLTPPRPRLLRKRDA